MVSAGGTLEQQAGTFMHELGHSLGLGHGGDDGINNKPNYFSVMSYTWQNPDGAFPESWLLDYSTGGAISPINEGSIVEAAGLGGRAGFQTLVGAPIPPGSMPGTPTPTQVVPQTGAVDFDQDGTLGTASLDLNFDGILGQTLTDFNDWGNLTYTIAPGAGSGSTFVPDDLEFTWELFLERSQTLYYEFPAGDGSDAVTLRRNGSMVQIVDDASGTVLVQRNLLDTRSIQVVGVGGENDQLTVDCSGGNPLPSAGLDFDGGSGASDTLSIVGASPTALFRPARANSTMASSLSAGTRFDLQGWSLSARLRRDDRPVSQSDLDRRRGQRHRQRRLH